ncbi:MAG TPA: glycosyltransferase [Gammaproteobacteria bacterium]
MKILHVIDSDGIYGAEVMLMNLVMEQKKLGHQPEILSIEDIHSQGFSLAEVAKSRELPVERLSTKRGFRLSTIRKILDYARVNKFDILHSHGYKGNILIGIVPHFLRHVPAVSTIHGWTAVSRFSKIWVYNLLDRYFLKRLEAIIFVNSSNTSAIIHKNKYSVENGIPKIRIDSSRVDSDDVTLIHPQGHNKFTIGCISRLSEEKGVGILIEAMSLLAKNNPDIQLVVIGDGILAKELQSLSNKRKIEQNVLFLGYRPDAYHYLPLFDVFVLPSLTEGLPITMLEAMQANIPIVATSVGAIPQVLEEGKNGLVIETNNAEALAEAILDVKNFIGRAKLRASNAKQAVFEHYASDKMAIQYINIYQEVIKEWK